MGLQELRAALAAVRDSEVLVGIPQEKIHRKKGKINNASLMYIMTHGSPIRNIPARPVIEPAIEAAGNKERIAAELKDAATAYLERDPQRAIDFLNRAGIAGMNASKRWFTDARNAWEPDKPATIKRKGSARPLIDTGQLRKSITFVVREGR